MLIVFFFLLIVLNEIIISSSYLLEDKMLRVLTSLFCHWFSTQMINMLKEKNTPVCFTVILKTQSNLDTLDVK